MRHVLPLLLCVSWWLSAQSTAAATATADDEIEKAVAQLSGITGLARLKKVQHDTITRAGVKQFLEEKIREEIRPEDIRLEELALKRFGLVPPDFDLKTATIDLITEQAAAFYDFRKKKLFVLEGDEPAGAGAEPGFGKAGQKMIVVHELAHALADQHFDLGKFIRKGRSDDSSTARMAVMEGQATWLMLESMAQSLGQSMRERSGMVDLMGGSVSETMSAQYPVLAKAPLYLRASLIFPYNQGLKFQHAVVQKFGNSGFSQVFRQPPASTQQVLHPEKYFADVEPVRVSLPDASPGREWRKILEGSVGEFDHSILIEQYVSKADAEQISPHWKGGNLALLENKSDKSIALLYASEWDDSASARRMFEAYRKVLEGKWKSMKVSAESDSEVSGVGDDGPFRLTLQANRLTSVEGLETGVKSRQGRMKTQETTQR